MVESLPSPPLTSSPMKRTVKKQMTKAIPLIDRKAFFEQKFGAAQANFKERFGHVPTIIELARECGCSYETINRWRNDGRIKMKNADAAIRFSELAGVPLVWLVRGGETET